MKKRKKKFGLLLFIALFIIAGLTTFYVLKKFNTDDKQVKGVFVLNERGINYENEV